jgi:hypothetical protein
MNKQVECITDFYTQLTKGRIYEVVYEYVDCIVVTNDLGYWKKYPIDSFRKLTKQEEVFTDKTKPTYYGTGFDVIDFCQKNNLDFMQGNVIKYVTRYKEKNGKEDLLKAREYIDRIIKEKYKVV